MKWVRVFFPAILMLVAGTALSACGGADPGSETPALESCSETCAQDSMYCRVPEGVCQQAVQAECVPRPQMCTMQYDPVCGCDGQTYSNACQAAASGVSIRHKGACPVQE